MIDRFYESLMTEISAPRLSSITTHRSTHLLRHRLSYSLEPLWCLLLEEGRTVLLLDISTFEDSGPLDESLITIDNGG